MSILTSILEKYLGKQLNPNRIENYLESLWNKGELKGSLKELSSAADVVGKQGQVRVSCVQRRIQMVKDVKEYVDLLHGFVATAVKEKSKLIVFPEYNFFDLCGLIPAFPRLNTYLNNKAKSVRSLDSGGNSKLLLYLFQAMAKPTARTIEMIFSFLARKYQIYIYTGTYMLNDKGKLYNAGALISRTGQIIGVQKKIHLTAFENALGLDICEDLEVYQLEIGKLALPICMDATYFETFKIARNLGADFVILPIANNEEYNPFKALRGIWPRVQESYLYGLKAALTGWFGGTHFTGKAGIFAPVELTKKKDGIIALSQQSEGNTLVTGWLDFNQLQEARKEAQYYGDHNLKFEENYFFKTYLPLLSGPKENKPFTE